jgi:hypothetical protein
VHRLPASQQRPVPPCAGRRALPALGR